jgi:hypothetical protein
MTNNNTAPHMDATGADNDPSFEQITPHVTREWLYGRRILVFRVTSFEDAEVDAWAKVYIEALTAWPPDRPFLAVQDISYRLFALTPRTRARIAEVYRLGRDTEGRVAVIVPNTFFTSREAGLAWLKECLDSELPQGGSAADEAQTDQG